MKTKALLMALVCLNSSISYSQVAEKKEDYGLNSRFALMLGGGASVVLNTLYLDPAINKTNNAVIIEKAGRIKPNLTVGIVYTPFVSQVTRTFKDKDNKDVTIREHIPRGFSTALFLNPVSLSKISETNMSSTVDLGLGLGWRSGNFSVFGTLEFFSIRQPRDYFIKQFQNNDLPYVVNGEVQASIANTDNDVFHSKVCTTFGIKLAYTIDLVKSFAKAIE